MIAPTGDRMRVSGREYKCISMPMYVYIRFCVCMYKYIYIYIYIRGGHRLIFLI